jgi:hypothetical protein
VPKLILGSVPGGGTSGDRFAERRTARVLVSGAVQTAGGSENDGFDVVVGSGCK